MKKKHLAWAACLMFSLVSGMPMAMAQSGYASYPAAPQPAVYSQEQLDQMLAPVALYPDSLLAQVLMASTYPLEVVQAQRFVEARPGLQGDGLARAVAPMPWDPSVKALVQFPSVLAMMNDRLDWMQQMGQAFISQQPAVMDTVQNLRERAQVAGTLQSSPQQRVMADDGVIVIEPVNPQVVYVPYYNPVVVYGSWWWPAAQPVYWAPPPRYRPPHYNPGITASISFSSGIGVMRSAFGEARPDWRQRQVMVTQTRINNVTNVTNNRVTNNVTNNVTVNRNVTVNQRPVVWHHDARHGGPRPQAGPNPQQAGGAAQPQARPQAQVQPHQQPQPQQAQAPRPAPAGVQQQRVMQEDQERQRQAREVQVAQARDAQNQQRQREQQVRDQQHQREQMINDQQRQREQSAREQQQQQQHQAQERQVQQRQQQMHDMQMQQAQQAREQQRQQQAAQQQQAQRQQQEQQRRQQEQAHQQQQQQHQQQEQARRQQEQARQQRNDRRDDGK